MCQRGDADMITIDPGKHIDFVHASSRCLCKGSEVNRDFSNMRSEALIAHRSCKEKQGLEIEDHGSRTV